MDLLRCLLNIDGRLFFVSDPQMTNSGGPLPYTPGPGHTSNYSMTRYLQKVQETHKDSKSPEGDWLRLVQVCDTTSCKSKLHSWLNLFACNVACDLHRLITKFHPTTIYGSIDFLMPKLSMLSCNKVKIGALKCFRT